MAGAHRSSGRGHQRSAADDAEFRRRVDELKRSVRVSSVVGKAIKLQRVGKEWKGLCPFHSERSPSFTVVDADEFAHCFGCQWHGDVIKFVMDKEGLTFRQAYNALANDDLPTWTPQEREKAQAEHRLDKLKDEDDARKFWIAAKDPVRSPVDTYLNARGITMPIPDCIRFGVVPWYRDKETGDWCDPRPAMICAATDLTGAVVGIQRIYFERNDPALGKAWRKLSLGSCRGAAMKLGPAEPTIIVPEAPEDGLSIMQEGPGFPVWVPFGTSMMPQIQFPSIVKRVILAGQNNTAGRVAVNKAAIDYSERGLLVDRAWPAAEFDDWNDQLRAGRQ